MAYPRYQLSRAHRSSRRTAGDITANGTAWANLHTDFDQTIEAQVGDVLLATPTFLVGNEAVDLYMDAVTVVGGSPVNSWGQAGAVTTSPPRYGVASWRCTGSAYTPIGAPARYTVVAGDIVSGKVTVRLRVATATATNRTIYSGANYTGEFAVWNIGPVDPE